MIVLIFPYEAQTSFLTQHRLLSSCSIDFFPRVTQISFLAQHRLLSSRSIDFFPHVAQISFLAQLRFLFSRSIVFFPRVALTSFLTQHRLPRNSAFLRFLPSSQVGVSSRCLSVIPSSLMQKFRELLKLNFCNRGNKFPRNCMSSKLHGIKTQHTIILIVKAVMIPNLTLLIHSFTNIFGDYDM